MRDWSLGLGDPLSLTFGADLRLGTPDYLNDHIWELELRGGEPPSLTVRTTYGLRARSLRLFYRFSEAGKSVVDPLTFHAAPRLRRFYPNFLLLDFVPVEGLEAVAEYWIPESHVLAGRLTLSNRTTFPRHLELELSGILTPLDGKGFAFTQHQMVNVLAGRTSDLQPVVFMAGSPRQGSGAHPGLAVGMDFDAGMSRTLTWACAAEGTSQASFELARRTVGRPWDAERARIELLDTREVVDIRTGDPDWDAALALSQKCAVGMFYPAGGGLPRPSFVNSRQPDGGFSRSGDGLDHPPAWSGQTPLETYYLSSLLPVAGELKRGVVENFLAVQAGDGSIDGKPGLAGQRSKYLAAPLLATIVWNCFEESRDTSFIEAAFPKLLAFYHAWFAGAQEDVREGLPTWEHILQTGFEDNPLFDVWYPWSQALKVSLLSSPELEAFLFREAASLMRLAAELGGEQELDELRKISSRLTASIAAGWNGRSMRYAYRDRQTGLSWPGKLIGTLKGPGELRPRKTQFDPPVRLLIQVETKRDVSRRPTIDIFGKGWDPSNAAHIFTGRARKKRDDRGAELDESIVDRQYQWHTGGWIAASECIYDQVDRITVDGLDAKDRLVVRMVDTTSDDITLFTPLWAHLPHPDHARAMVDRLKDGGSGFDRPLGVPALPASPAGARAGVREKTEADALAMSVRLPWNQLVGEGMLSYGFREEAAHLTERLMRAVIHCLKDSHAFYERYHAETGSGLGERGAVTGCAPVGLFLKTLGVQLLSPSSVRLEGRNPFPWPVSISYRGLTVVRGMESTEVMLPNGEKVTVTDPAPCVVSL